MSTIVNCECVHIYIYIYYTYVCIVIFWASTYVLITIILVVYHLDWCFKKTHDVSMFRFERKRLPALIWHEEAMRRWFQPMKSHQKKTTFHQCGESIYKSLVSRAILKNAELMIPRCCICKYHLIQILHPLIASENGWFWERGLFSGDSC